MDSGGRFASGAPPLGQYHPGRCVGLVQGDEAAARCGCQLSSQRYCITANGYVDVAGLPSQECVSERSPYQMRRRGAACKELRQDAEQGQSLSGHRGAGDFCGAVWVQIASVRNQASCGSSFQSLSELSRWSM